MTQDERWNKRYQDVMDFMEKNHKNPSRHRLEEHDMLNWLKSNRKKMNAGELLEQVPHDDYQLIFSASYIVDELNIPKYTVGDYYSQEHKSLKNV